MPATEQQLQLLVQQLRRQGHLAEGAPGNVASILHGPLRQARPGAYLSEQEPQQQEGISLNAATSQSAYWGQTTDLRQPAAYSPERQALERDSPDLSSAWWGAASTVPPEHVSTALPDSVDAYFMGDSDEDSSATSSDSGTDRMSPASTT